MQVVTVLCIYICLSLTFINNIPNIYISRTGRKLENRGHQNVWTYLFYVREALRKDREKRHKMKHTLKTESNAWQSINVCKESSSIP